MPQAKAAALRALEIDELLAEAHTALGFYLSNYESSECETFSSTTISALTRA